MCNAAFLLPFTLIVCHICWYGDGAVQNTDRHTGHGRNLEENFQLDMVMDFDSPITDFVWTPDKKWIVVTSKNGDVSVFNAETFENIGVAGTLNPVLCTERERGLQAVQVHPEDYDSDQRYVLYLLFVVKGAAGCPFSAESGLVPHPDGPVVRLSRFILNVSTRQSAVNLDLGSENIFFESGPVGGIHFGGGLAFGKDTNIYVTVGDAGHSNRLAATKQTDSLYGKILRFTDNGDIPEDNPYVDSADVRSIRCGMLRLQPADGTIKCQEIFTRGFRNPFTLEMDPNVQSVRYFVNDVGQKSWEEVNEGGVDQAGKYYGWPEREGPCGFAQVSGPTCEPSANDEWVDPLHFYDERPAAVTGGTFVPTLDATESWSTKFGGEYLLADYVLNTVYHMKRDESLFCRGESCPKQASAYSNTPILTGLERPTRIRFGPYQANSIPQKVLYVLEYARNRIQRATLLPAVFNLPPKLDVRTFYALHESTESGGLIVTFDAGGSVDPEGSPLFYKWSFGDQNRTSSEAVAVHTYTTPGQYTATLIVEDAQGGISTKTMLIVVPESIPGESPETFQWAIAGLRGSGCAADTTADFCGALQFCHNAETNEFGYRIPGSYDCSVDLQSPVIRLEAGYSYELILQNAAELDDITTTTNLHTHGLHISGSGDSDDVTRRVSAGNCLKYRWDIPVDHPDGTYFYHPHAHQHAEAQLNGGAFGLLIVENNFSLNPQMPAWASNELLLQIGRLNSTTVLGNKKSFEVLQLQALQWYRLRVSVVDADAMASTLEFTPGCTVHKVASDGIWHSTVPFPPANSYMLTGSSRADFAIQCPVSVSFINILFREQIVAIVRVGSKHDAPFVMEEWTPVRPMSLRNITGVDVPPENSFAVTIQRDSINNKSWDPETPLAEIAFNEVHEWDIGDTVFHPFHLHLYHMMIVSPGGCGAHKEGEFYDTISGPPCKVRFKTADIGERFVFHCHVMSHSDAGATAYMNVVGEGMPINNNFSGQVRCPTGGGPRPSMSSFGSHHLLRRV